MSPLKIVFLGSDPIALPLLEWLSGGGGALAHVIAVFTQPDRPVGRGQKIQANGIKTWALARALPVFQPEKLTDAVRADLAALGADVALVMAYGHILRDEFIATPRLGTLNFHASILPQLRGASPIQSVIASGAKETGVSLMRIVRRLDAGPVADIERVPIALLDTAREIECKLAGACVPLLARALPKLIEGSLAFVEQEESAATYCRRLEKEDGAIDFAAPASVIAARINGLFPWPACSVELNGQAVKLGGADLGSAGVWPAQDSGPGVRAPTVPDEKFLVMDDNFQNPGTVLGADAEGLLVRTGEGVLRLRSLQRPGGKMLAAAEFLRGFPVQPGTVIVSRPMPPLVAREPFRR